jgi:hypothetical protein
MDTKVDEGEALAIKVLLVFISTDLGHFTEHHYARLIARPSICLIPSV